jgi:pyridoxal phosphate enzyme (YggS family)
MEAVKHTLHTLSTSLGRTPPRLVAVSKLQPVAAVLAAYAQGCRHFGENYVQELLEKAPQCPQDIAWHFIGQLQSNKAKALVAGVPNLWAVESVDSAKLAQLLDKAAAARGVGGGSGGGSGGGGGGEAAPPQLQPLGVYVQVNTSGEEQKGGVAPGEGAALARYIRDQCPHLQLRGLMTIGKLGEVASVYFERLTSEREAVAQALGVAPASLELSMGMSSDYELATQMGSSNVRVGSAIFGAREAK